MSDKGCVEKLLSWCPAFAPHLEEAHALYGDEPVRGSLMFDLAAFGEYAAEAIGRGDETEFASIGEVAERLLGWPAKTYEQRRSMGFSRV